MNQLIDYINRTVLPDYAGFVASGRQYKDDAVVIEESAASFDRKFREITRFITDMISNFTAIATAVEESAKAIGNAASSTTELVGEINNNSREMNNTNDIVRTLETEVKYEENIFKP